MVNRVLHSTVPRWNYAERGTDFLSEDWDNLIILDACRHDLLAANGSLPGDLQKRESKAASTVDFLKTNLDGGRFHDTVYVTANGQIFNFRDEIDVEFHEIVPLYAEEWDDESGTVRPEDVTRRAKEASERFPDKRLLIHYVQPHMPFIGSETEADKRRESDGEDPFWLRVFCGEVDLSPDELWAAYEATLELTLPHVRELMSDLPGRTVVTSDHGNMFGERAHPIPIREWGHPSGVYTPELVEVPWLVHDDGSRKRIVTEPPRDTELKSDPAVVKERLEDLGYR